VKKFFKERWKDLCEVVGFLFAMLMCLIVVTLPFTVLIGLVWLILKMLGVI
jgi:hypothetical protein